MDEFIQQLIREQGIGEDVAVDVRTQLVSELTERATDFINRRLVDAMSDEAVEQFNNLLDDQSVQPQQVQDFVATNVPNRDQVVVAALVEFRGLYLGDKA